MKNIKYVIFLLLILIIPKKIDAACFTDDNARLKEIISNVNISYDYEIVNNKAIFSIKFTNVVPEIFFRDSLGNSYYGDENNEVVLYNYPDGQSYTFAFYGLYDCSNNSVMIRYVNIPTYNAFYKLNVCKGAEEYKLCQKWVSHSLTRKEFIKNVEKYKNNEIIVDDSKPDKMFSAIDFAVSFIKMYGLYILGGILIIIIVVKIVKYKKDTFGF